MSKLQVPENLSIQFKKFNEDFSSNIEDIIKFEFKRLNKSIKQNPKEAEYEKLKCEKIIEQCCYRSTKYEGPHLVLQIFVEKITKELGAYSEELIAKLKEADLIEKEMDRNQGYLPYTINGIDLNVIFKIQGHLQQQNADLQGVSS
mmetsp:Transcript_7800/g.12087  ORF Transcript_7800/g.12087 Transcript_7800/m.12087 type:complete len:146 (+) Transcript_7800:910-1347(+)